MVQRSRLPRLRLHRPSERAVGSLNGRDFYVGVYGTPEANAEYDRLIAKWLINGRRLPHSSADLTINELIDVYLQFANGCCRKPDGMLSDEFPPIVRALKPLRDMFGHTLASEFGSIKLKAVRKRFIDDGRVRLRINAAVRRIIRMFKRGDCK